MRVGHPLYVANSTSNYNLEIVYRPGNNKGFSTARNAVNATVNMTLNTLGNASTSGLSPSIPGRISK